MDLGMALIYCMVFAACVLVIIGFILLCKFLPDVQNPFKKLPKQKDVSLNVVKAPQAKRPQPKPVEKSTLKDAWNTISQEAKKEIPTMKVEIPPLRQGPPVQTPFQQLPPEPKKKPLKRRLSPAELAKRKIDTRPGGLKS
jgi:hypothetical protein